MRGVTKQRGSSPCLYPYTGSVRGPAVRSDGYLTPSTILMSKGSHPHLVHYCNPYVVAVGVHLPSFHPPLLGSRMGTKTYNRTGHHHSARWGAHPFGPLELHHCPLGPSSITTRHPLHPLEHKHTAHTPWPPPSAQTRPFIAPLHSTPSVPFHSNTTQHWWPHSVEGVEGCVLHDCIPSGHTSTLLGMVRVRSHTASRRHLSYTPQGAGRRPHPHPGSALLVYIRGLLTSAGHSLQHNRAMCRQGGGAWSGTGGRHQTAGDTTTCAMCYKWSGRVAVDPREKVPKRATSTLAG